MKLDLSVEYKESRYLYYSDKCENKQEECCFITFVTPSGNIVHKCDFFKFEWDTNGEVCGQRCDYDLKKEK